MIRAIPPRTVRILATAMVALLAGACNGSTRSSHPPAQAADSILEGSVDVATAEHVVREYFASLVERRTMEARELLAAGPRSDMSVEEMERVAAAVQAVRIRKLDAQQMTGDRIVFRAMLDVTPNPAVSSDWREGVNTRWIEVVHSRRGWRIARVASAPVTPVEPSLVRQWAQVHILEAGLSLEVPNAWQGQPGRWAWSPPGRPTSTVEVRWDDGAGGADSLPPANGGRVVRTTPVNVPWGSGTEYALEVPATTEDSSVVSLYRMYFVVRSSDTRRTIAVMGEARHPDELRALRPVLRRMLTSMAFATPSSVTAEESQSRNASRRDDR